MTRTKPFHRLRRSRAPALCYAASGMFGGLSMRWLINGVACCFVVGALGLVLNAPAALIAKGKDKPKVELKVKVGDTAPVFDSVNDLGRPADSSMLVGKKVLVLFFYPSDFTGNAVAQARGYQDEYDSLTKAGAVVAGGSGDPVMTHQMFKAYYRS